VTRQTWITTLYIAGGGRLHGELRHWCRACYWTSQVQQTEARLADPTLHPAARPRLTDALAYERAQLRESSHESA
jgi:hypothetical protein